MNVVFHPEFPRDQRKFEADYGEISPALAERFRGEIDGAIVAIKAVPGGAGHFLNTSSHVVPEFRRCNLHAFPFFVFYGRTGDTLIFGAIIPTRSWLSRGRPAGISLKNRVLKIHSLTASRPEDLLASACQP